MDRYEVALGEELIERDQLRIELRGPRRLEIRVVGQDLHAEGGHTLCDQLTDSAEADDAEFLLVELSTGVLRASPLPVLQRRVRWRDETSRGKDQTDGELGCRDDVRRWSIDHHHASSGSGGDIDIVETDSSTRDDFESFCRSDRFRVHLRGRANQHCINALREGRKKFIAICTIAIADFEVRS
ncbi:unannotated protein [freshwater metagenome]|uniref:Unannotated protein n=1 Tax=freshwater metagenome TaxID=449393 RepID=A0A6J6EJ23_9ZZZZ